MQAQLCACKVLHGIGKVDVDRDCLYGLLRLKAMKQSLRMKGWDYSRSSTYLITICTKNRQRFFGEMRNGQLVLSEMGRIAQESILSIPEYSPNTRIRGQVVMPDHVHFIISFRRIVSTDDSGSGAFHPQKGTLGSVIRGYKSGVTSRIRKIKTSFEWQTRYHDQILSTENAIQEAYRYIKENPMNANS